MIPEEQTGKQIAQGNYIAQADQKSTAIVAVYHNVSPRQIDPVVITAAQQKLAELSAEIVPDIGPVPAGSRMPFKRNPLFVGREADLRILAAMFKSSEMKVNEPSTIVAVTGLGGKGKTQLVSEFVHRYG